MTQKELIIQRLLETGEVDNFWSIENKVSIRLGAIIHMLRKKGWKIESKMLNKNCHYILKARPDGLPTRTEEQLLKQEPQPSLGLSLGRPSPLVFRQ